MKIHGGENFTARRRRKEYRAAMLAPLLRGVLVVLAAATWAHAQPQPKVARIGVVFYQTPLAELTGAMPASLTGRALVEGLAERGWVVGRNAQIHWRSAEGRYDRLPGLVRELLDIPIDVLVAGGNDIAAESVKRSPSTPVVLASSDFPVESGLVTSLARPGGNITGLSNWIGTSLNAKRLSLLKEAVPAVSRVAVIGPTGLTRRRFSPETQAAADALGIQLLPINIDKPEDGARAFAEAIRAGANGVLVLDYPFAFVRANQVLINDLAMKHRLPVLHSASTAADSGSLLTYAPDITVNFRRAGYFVDRILRGAKAGELPIEQPDTLHLVVNTKVARSMGLTIPVSVLTQASRVISE
jgi:putative ABC transport system substrate-binding protein